MQTWKNVAPCDSVPLDPVPDGLYVGGAGLLVLVGCDGVSGTFTVLAGSYHPLQPRYIKATGTTATGIVALGGYKAA